ncbi:MAG: hypothetical protein QM752_00990 [Gammaproteobacteria bacterium]
MMRKIFSRILYISLLVCTCFSLIEQPTFADPEPAQSVTSHPVDCDLAPNPEQCRIEQSQGKAGDFDAAAFLNAQILDLMGPYSAAVRFDNDLGWILGLGYVQMFNENVGLALKGGFGPNEVRANVTGGFSIGPYNQLKMTYEYLTQNPTFNFTSGGIREWVSQQAFGGAYQLLLKKGMVHSVELSGSFAKAHTLDGDLATLVYYDGDDAYYNIRNIAPGREGTGLATLNLNPFTQTALSLGAGYSEVRYDTQYSDSQNNSTVAYKAEVNHIFHPTVKLTAAVNNTASNTNYKAKVNKIWHEVELALGGEHQSSRGELLNATNVFVGISYPAPKRYALAETNNLMELRNWIEKPVVYYTRVLAIKDELTQRYTLEVAQPIPGQTKAETEVIDPVDVQDYFSFDPNVYDSVDYTFTATRNNDPKDYSKDLKLVIISQEKYQGTLQSAEPLPIGLADNYTMTVTATGHKKGLDQPVTQTNTFTLVVTAVAPSWTDKLLPSAAMGSSYTNVELRDGYIVVPDNASSSDYTFSMVSGPEWIVLQDGHLLTAAPGKVVPQDQSAAVPVVLKVTDQANRSSQKNFSVAINQLLPEWDGSANYQNWSIKYDDTQQGIVLNPYVTVGTQDLTFSFKNNELKTGNWVIVNDNGTSYLRRTTPSSPLPDDVGQVTSLLLVAHNTTSTADVQEQKATQAVKINVTADNGLPAPAWNTTELVTTAGTNPLQVALVPLLKESIKNDSYTFQLATNTQSQWLKLSDDGQTLMSNGAVPPISDQAAGQVQFTLNAVSKASGIATGATTFTLTVNNLAPVWMQNIPAESVTIPYDATVESNQPGIYLNPLINLNTANLKFYFADTQTQNGNWTIVQKGSDYYLKRLKADASDIGNAPPVKVYAYNSTSNGGVVNALNVIVVGDANQPGASWNTTLPTGTKAGTPPGQYTFPLQQLFTCPANDTCRITVELNGISDWMKAQNQGPNDSNTEVELINTDVVPAADTDPAGDSKPFHMTVNSLVSGKTIDKDFQIPIENVLPSWQKVDLIEVAYDDIKTALPTVTGGLPALIAPGTDLGIAFQIDPTAQCAANFTAKNWTLAAFDTVFYRSSAGQSDMQDIAANDSEWVQLPIKATNKTSVNGTTQCLPIKVTADGTLPSPSWTGEIPDGDMGYPYATVDLNGVDANGNKIATGSVSNDTLTFAFAGSHPSWLDLQPCTVQNKASQCLVPVGNIPTASDNFNVALSMTSKASGKTTEKTFEQHINQQLPAWVPYPTATLAYDNADAGIDLAPLIQDGKGNPQGALPALWFKLRDPKDLYWIIQESAGHYYLKMTTMNPAYNNLNAIGSPAAKPPAVIAYNNTSQQGVSGVIQVNITADSSKPGPSWNGNSPKAAEAGDAANLYQDGVQRLFTCPADDRCQINVDLGPISSWIDQQITPDKSEVTLFNTTRVPTADTDPSGLSAPFAVNVYSVASGKTLAQDFQILIQNVLPVWKDPATVPQLLFDGKSADTTIHLNDYITQGKLDLSFKAGANFDAKNWRIIQGGPDNSDYYLQRTTTASPQDVGTTIEVPIIATNSTSQTGQSHLVAVAVVADPNAIATWQGDLPIAYMGYAYGWDGSNLQTIDLTQMVSTPDVSGDSYTFAFDDSQQPHPAWLALNGSQLVSTGNVPKTAGNAFNVSIQVTNKASGKPVTQPFTVHVQQVLPGWVDNPSGHIPFNSLDTGIELDALIEVGEGNPKGDQPVLSFAMKNAADPDWKISHQNGKSYLMMTEHNPAYNQVNTVGKTATPSPVVVAYNNTSVAAVEQAITVQMDPDNSQGVPVWKAENPSDTFAGTANYQIHLADLVDDPAKGTSYIFTIESLTGTQIADPNTWLQMSADGQSLQAALVPVATLNPPDNATITLKVTARSTVSGQLSQPQILTFHVNNILPQWQDNPAGSLDYDQADAGIPLTQFITAATQGSAQGPQPALSFALTEAAKKDWIIVPRDNDYYLQLNPQGTVYKNSSDINKTLDVPVLALNNTSVGAGTVQNVAIHLTAQPPAWTGNQLLPSFVLAANTYQTDLNQAGLLTGIPGDTYQFTVVKNAQGGATCRIENQSQLICDNAQAAAIINAQGTSIAGFSLTLQATSNLSKLSPATTQDVIVKVTPSFTQNKNVALRFDDIKGAQLNNGKTYQQGVIINPNGLPVACQINGGQGNYIAQNWTMIAHDNNCYLARKINNDQIDSQEIGQPVTLSIQAAYGDNSTVDATSSSLDLTVDPDPAVIAKWIGLDSAFNITGIYPNNNSILLSMDIRNLVSTFVDLAGEAKSTEVINDTVAFQLAEPLLNWLKVDQGIHLQVMDSDVSFIGRNPWALNFNSSACGATCANNKVTGLVPIDMAYQVVPLVYNDYYNFMGYGTSYKPYYTSLVVSGLPQQKQYRMSYNLAPVSDNPVVCSAVIKNMTDYDHYLGTLPDGDCPNYDQNNWNSYIQPLASDISVIWYYLNDTKKTSIYPGFNSPNPIITVRE